MDEVVDVDIMLKFSAYGLLSSFQAETVLGLLAVSKYVVAKRIARTSSINDKERAVQEFSRFLERASIFEPTADEVGFAAMLEKRSQDLGLSLDIGESQLLAAVVHRGLSRCWTGDKRAIASAETLLDEVSELQAVSGKLSCLEQAALGLLEKLGANSTRGSICGEPAVDLALSNCFSCYSGQPVNDSVVAGLSSYIEALRHEAPRILSS